MSFFPNRTTFLRIGNISIQWYAVLILTGAFVAYYFAKRNLKKYHNIEINGFFDDIFIYMLWGGLIGARLWYCIFDPNVNYLQNPLQILKVWDGGVAIHGAFIGGIIVAFFYCKKKNVPFIKFCDAVVPTMLIAQGIGRWGNFINQECYGQIVDESYYNGILSFIKDSMFISEKGVLAYREPMFLYESLLCILGFILINFVLRKYQNKRGDLTWAYLMWYGVIRFFIEGRRTDSLYMNILPWLKTAQLTSILYLIIGLLGFFGIVDKLLGLNKRKPTILFDLDGTIQDSQGIIIETYKELFKRHDKVENFTLEKQTEVLGPGLLEMFPKYFPDLDPQKLFDEYQDINKELLEKDLKPMPNAENVLKTLHDEGYKIGIITTRTYKSTMKCLQICGINNYIDDCIGLEDVEKTKPDIEAFIKIIDENKWNKSDIIMIGDSIADIKGGKDYGCYTVAYLFNENKKEKVLALDPNKSITDLNEVLDIVKENHYFTYNLK